METENNSETVQTDADDTATNRERILLVAIREFAASGFVGTSMNRIAEQTGLNKQLIYHYFGNKRLLYEAVMGRMLSATGGDLEIEDVDSMFDGTRAIEGADTWFRLLGWEGLQEPVEQIPFPERRKGAFSQLEKLVKSQQREGLIDAEAETDMVTLLWSLALIAPHVFPQLTLVITGQLPDDAFETRMQKLLRTLFGRHSEGT